VIHPKSGNTQGGIFSAIAFNIQVDNVVRYWLSQELDDNGEISDGLRHTIERILALFYADDGCLSTVDHEWLQRALNTLVALFKRIGLETNTQKTVLLTSHPPTDHINLSQQAYKRKITGEGPTFRERQRQAVPCPLCNVTLRRGSLTPHLQRIHGTEPDYDHDIYSTTSSSTNTASSPTPYRVSFPKGTPGICHPCPVPGCFGRFKQPAGLRRHFMTHHPYDSVCILEEGGNPLPRCHHCDMHTPYAALNRHHLSTRSCKLGGMLKQRRRLQEQRRRDQELTI
jgi:hypothetical protein